MKRYDDRWFISAWTLFWLSLLNHSPVASLILPQDLAMMRVPWRVKWDPMLYTLNSILDTGASFCHVYISMKHLKIILHVLLYDMYNMHIHTYTHTPFYWTHGWLNPILLFDLEAFQCPIAGAIRQDPCGFPHWLGKGILKSLCHWVHALDSGTPHVTAAELLEDSEPDR